MKNYNSLYLLPLFASLLTGCSKGSAGASASSPNRTDMGVIEVTDGIPIQQSLGGGRGCVIVPTVFPNASVSLSIEIVETNSAGIVQTLAKPRVQNFEGQAMEVSVGDIAIRLIPKIKH